jgi:hypothetical protein
VREAEDSTLLEAVARELLIRQRKLEKGIVGTEVICELWRLAVAL